MMLETLQQKDPPSEFVDIAERNRKNESLGMNCGERVSQVEDYAAAQEEWEAVQCVEPILRSPYKEDLHKSPKKFINGSSSSPAKSPSMSPQALAPNVRITPHTDFDEVWDFFTRQDMSHVMGSIKPTLERRGVNGLFRTIFGPKKLKAELVDERNLLFAIAQCQFDNSEPIHLQILQTVYKVLTGTKIDCPRFGNHWDVIGFQGLDPATDLRGVGLLGLVHALHLLTYEAVLPLARDIFRLSHDQHSQFPFMVLSINVTRISLQTLREGHLNKECNSRGNVRHVLNEYFTAVMFHIYWIWKTECKTIKDSGFLIKDAEAYCKRNVKTVLQKLQAQLRKYSHQEAEML
ncbi:ELMO domain-containing protein 3-like [Penaeus japonicus]|uniref:ELMO domain-containing protein 3-like n=1 Tax=Penaeus japonicus TaxID=27405 RepID=UPI001C70DB0D|nr:ELMO domain-containing protein 3-like [Penaeus japonicus]XP_042880855.1 ELMO domain-containing protein 3-like [Penaeus japonicus]XP_042880856.1 ELMO domain-containing protein 3-like [Penaeus japonicus]